MDAYWRAANYLSVGQIYLYDNPLLKKPLKREHIKPRLLGHWGTTPGLNLIYVHLNRVIKERDLNVIYITGPGHGGPGLVANTYLEGTYSEVYPNMSQDEAGMKRLFKQFSFPGGIPSHVAPETPGSIHEGGELGYSLSHAFGAAFDNPDLIVACVVGDGEAETGPLATSWHSNKFLNPVRDGAVLPILHLNGYKIAGPTVLARLPQDELESSVPRLRLRTVLCRRRRTARACINSWPQRSTPSFGEIKSIQADARGERFPKTSALADDRPAHAQRLDRAEASWTERQVEGTFRAHQVPMGDMDKPAHIKILERWMKSYKPQELFDKTGKLRAELAELAPKGDAPHGRQSARQWRTAACAI